MRLPVGHLDVLVELDDVRVVVVLAGRRQEELEEAGELLRITIRQDMDRADRADLEGVREIGERQTAAVGRPHRVAVDLETVAPQRDHELAVDALVDGADQVGEGVGRGVVLAAVHLHQLQRPEEGGEQSLVRLRVRLHGVVSWTPDSMKMRSRPDSLAA